MKRQLLFIICAFISIALISCKKDKSTNQADNNVYTNEISFKLNGVQLHMNYPFADIDTAHDLKFRYLELNAFNDSIVFWFVSTQYRTGLQKIDTSKSTPVIEMNIGGWLIKSISGNVEFTLLDTINNQLAGTFNCISLNSKDSSQMTITDGKFSFNSIKRQ